MGTPFVLPSAAQFIALTAGTLDFTFAQSYSLSPVPQNSGAIPNKLYKYFAQDPNTGDWERGTGLWVSLPLSVFVLQRTTIEWTSAENQNRFPFVAPPQVAMWLPTQTWLWTPGRGYIDGLNMVTGLGNIQVFPGIATDSTNYKMLSLSTSLAKNQGAPWAPGPLAGALDTGTFVGDTWYWVFLIENETTQVCDVLISAANNSAAFPTPAVMPAGYTLWRYIGSRKSNHLASGWIGVQQDGDYNRWLVPLVEYSAINNPGTAAVLQTMNLPLGIRVRGKFCVSVQNTGTLNQPAQMLLSDPQATDNAPGNNNASEGFYEGSLGANFMVTGTDECFTDTSQRIRTRMSYSDANIFYYLSTIGWVDTRGKDAISM